MARTNDVASMYWEDVCVKLRDGEQISDSDLDRCAQYNAQGASDGVIMSGDTERNGELAGDKMYGEILDAFAEARGGRCIDNHHHYEFDRSCGATVCQNSGCGDHKGFARCFCGWSRSGGDGRAELEAMGEQIDDDY